MPTFQGPPSHLPRNSTEDPASTRSLTSSALPQMARPTRQVSPITAPRLGVEAVGKWMWTMEG